MSNRPNAGPERSARNGWAGAALALIVSALVASACGATSPGGAGGAGGAAGTAGSGGQDGGGSGELCSSNQDCADGLLCCYPCGIEGCQNRCMAPAPRGGCPLFP